MHEMGAGDDHLIVISPFWVYLKPFTVGTLHLSSSFCQITCNWIYFEKLSPGWGIAHFFFAQGIYQEMMSREDGPFCRGKNSSFMSLGSAARLFFLAHLHVFYVEQFCYRALAVSAGHFCFFSRCFSVHPHFVPCGNCQFQR